MNITIHVSPSLQNLLRGSQMVSGYAVMQRAGQAVTDYLRRYHQAFLPHWKGFHYMEPSLGFGDKVAAGWQDPVVSGSRVTITNTFGLLKHKVTGGAIMPQRAQFLTIPLTSEAKGKTVAEYRASSGTPLFRAGMALCERIGGRVSAVYALSKGLTQDPWPGAMPPQEAINQVFVMAANQEIARQLGTRMAA